MKLDKDYYDLDKDSDKEFFIKKLRQTINTVNEIVDWINEYENNGDEIIPDYMENVKDFYKIRKKNR